MFPVTRLCRDFFKILSGKSKFYKSLDYNLRFFILKCELDQLLLVETLPLPSSWFTLIPTSSENWTTAPLVEPRPDHTPSSTHPLRPGVHVFYLCGRGLRKVGSEPNRVTWASGSLYRLLTAASHCFSLTRLLILLPWPPSAFQAEFKRALLPLQVSKPINVTNSLRSCSWISRNSLYSRGRHAGRMLMSQESGTQHEMYTIKYFKI